MAHKMMVTLDGTEYTLEPVAKVPEEATEKKRKLTEDTDKLPKRTCTEVIQEAIDTKRGHDKLLDSEGNEWELKLKRKASNVPDTFDVNSPHAKRFAKPMPKLIKFELDDILGVWRHTKTGQMFKVFKSGDDCVYDHRDAMQT